jgi:hypothetical protein
MRSAKAVGIVVLALLAIGALMATTASAAKEKPPLVLRTAKGVLKEKAEVKATSKNVVTTTTAGKVECTETVLTGEVTTNEKPKNILSYATATLTGAEAEKACKSSVAAGAAKVTASHVPWREELSAEGKAVLKGVAIEEDFANGEKCVYTARAKGKSNVGAHEKPEAITQTFEKGKLELKKHGTTGSETTCPKEGELSGTFTLTSAGETVEAEKGA